MMYHNDMMDGQNIHIVPIVIGQFESALLLPILLTGVSYTSIVIKEWISNYIHSEMWLLIYAVT